MQKLHSGILVHGRHLQARGWENMVWGDAAANALGTLPTAVLAMLNESSPLELITFGTGGSQDASGRFESEVTKQLLVDRFDDLEQFPTIASHPRWLQEKESIRKLVAGAVADTVSQNTKEEIALAAQLFQREGITKVIEVTGASHGPRCQQLQNIARADGTIPRSQHWQLVTDDVPYTDSLIGDTAVFEEPHRGDDPMLHVPQAIRPAKLFSQFFLIPMDRRESFLRDLAQLLQKYRSQ